MHLNARPHHEDKARFCLKKCGKAQPSEPALRPGPLKHTLGFLLFARARNPAARGQSCVSVRPCVSMCPCVCPCPVTFPGAFPVPFSSTRSGSVRSAAETRGSQPRSCCFVLFSSCPNRRGQVRCASKHCNHILNGNEMCELNVNYGRMEGQSLLVKV